MDKHVADSFEFRFDGSRPLVSDAILLASVRAYGELVGGRPFGMVEFSAWKDRAAGANTISRRFGSWRKALLKAGIHGVKGRDYDPDELVEHLEQVWRKVGRAPGVRSLRRHGHIGNGPYVRRWGSLQRACAAFAKFKKGEMSREELLAVAEKGLKGVWRGGRAAIKPSVRWRVLERDGQKCTVCGRTAADGAKLEVDHIVAVADGGGDEESNLRVLCWSCNRGKGGGKGGRKKKVLTQTVPPTIPHAPPPRRPHRLPRPPSSSKTPRSASWKPSSTPAKPPPSHQWPAARPGLEPLHPPR